MFSGCNNDKKDIEEITMLCQRETVYLNNESDGTTTTIPEGHDVTIMKVAGNSILELTMISDWYLGLPEEYNIDNNIDQLIIDSENLYKDYDDIETINYKTNNSWHTYIRVNLRNPEEKTLQLFEKDSLNEDGTVNYEKMYNGLVESKYSCSLK